MRKIILFLILLVSVLSCKNAPSVFFEYDQIDYYYNKNKEIISIKIKDEIKSDSISKSNIVSIDNLQYENYLIEDGYGRYSVNPSSFKEIDHIFVEKNVSKNRYSKCFPIYKDILVFKKKGKAVGIAEICFTCGQNTIIGTQARTDNFGQDGDYEKLEKLLTEMRN